MAHSILVIAYHLIQRKEPYTDLGSNYFDERGNAAVANFLIRRLEKLGYAVSIKEPAVEVQVTQ